MRIFRLILIAFFVVIASGYASAFNENDTIVTTGSITITGNKVTKNHIIIRELEFKEGIVIGTRRLDSLILKSKQNLLNRSLFNFVDITRTEGETSEITVSVVERWYIWPVPILQFADRNINAWLEKGDLSRLNFGIDLRVDNFRGRMERLDIVLQAGYDVKVEMKWTVPYLTKNQVLGVTIDGGVLLNHTVAYETIGGKEQFFTSMSTYAQKKVFGTLGLTLRPKYNFYHGFQLGYNHFDFMDTLLVLNPNFANKLMYNYLSVSYVLKLDFRDYASYPLQGYYFDLGVSKMGFGIFSKDVNRISMNASFDQYLQLAKRWYFAYNLSGQISNNNQRLPYFIKSGLGYHPNNIRGYELYVVDGQQVGIFKSNFKFEVLPRWNFNINWIKSTKFNKSFLAIYANVFFDMAYVGDVYTNDLNPLANQLLYGTGIGIDMLTYYDLVLRLEYSLNKQKQTGFFISFVAPI